MALDDKFVAFWNMDTNGSVPDAVASNDLTNNGATYTASGKINGAYSFTTNDFLSRTGVLTSSFKAVCLWFNSDVAITADSTQNTLIHYDSNNAGKWLWLGSSNGSYTNEFISLSDGAGGFWYWTFADCGVSSPLASGSYHNIIITWEAANSSYRLYFDGSDAGLANEFGTPSEITTWDDITIGRRATNYYEGDFDAIGVCDVELDSSDAATIWNSGDGAQYPFTPPVPPGPVNTVVGGGRRVNSWLNLINFDALMYKVVEFSNAQLRDWGLLSPHVQIADDFSALVVKVHDGDTITVRTNFRDFDFPVRISGIDAPELSEGGKEAGDWLRKRLLGKKVMIRVDNSNRVGKYGRIIGSVFHKGFDVADEMRMRGLVYEFGQRNLFDIPPIDKILSKHRVSLS